MTKVDIISEVSRAADITKVKAEIAVEAVLRRADERGAARHQELPEQLSRTALQESLRSAAVTDLVVAGMMTHMCVDTSVRAPADLGFTCTVAHDACATRNLAFGGREVDAASVQIAYMAALNGAFGTALATDDVCAALERGTTT